MKQVFKTKFCKTRGIQNLKNEKKRKSRQAIKFPVRAMNKVLRAISIFIFFASLKFEFWRKYKRKPGKN